MHVEVRDLPVGAWLPATRRKRNELEQNAALLEHDVDAVLAMPTVPEAVSSLHLDGKTREEKLEGLVRLARHQVDGAERASEAERVRLETIIDAAKTARRNAHSHRRAGARPGQGLLRLAPGAQMPRVEEASRAHDEVAEVLVAIASARARQEGAEQLASVDAAIERMSATAHQVRQDTARVTGVYSEVSEQAPSAADVRESVRAARAGLKTHSTTATDAAKHRR
ncbi:hypothetical protein [Olsenella sp. Marseille-P4559]|uniref:hypothetical protein n=1 Tax=Olsenella sp. Marseille-P4559 TaxID=2364795 RepID=UPI0010319570|nr:hypothetical protein [Olsenella sp. Marseille-P4559]